MYFFVDPDRTYLYLGRVASPNTGFGIGYRDFSQLVGFAHSAAADKGKSTADSVFFLYLCKQYVHIFGSIFILKWVPAGAWKPQNQSQGGQVQPQTELSSNVHRFLTPFWEPWGTLGVTFGRPWPPLGHLFLSLSYFVSVFFRIAFGYRFGA